MSVKLGTLVNEEFQLVIKNLASSEMPIKAAYKFKDAVKQINEEISKFRDFRNEIMEKYAVKGEDGKVAISPEGTYTVAEENVQAFSKETEELLNLAIELPKFKLDDLGDKLKIAPKDLFLLDGFIEG